MSNIYQIVKNEKNMRHFVARKLEIWRQNWVAHPPTLALRSLSLSRIMVVFGEAKASLVFSLRFLAQKNACYGIVWAPPLYTRSGEGHSPKPPGGSLAPSTVE